MLRLDLQREVMRRVLPVFLRVSPFIATAADEAADEADPEVVGAVADAAERGFAAAEGRRGGR